ncbi:MULTISPECIES: M23 family metallopeptidase [Persicobacter]|uniref:LysM domain-containing protein n=1 Tax=Persicobacter diffluens TaxID=981 RepID=A0AAN5AIH2_9BACT|nr:M23 family metallopeptidase [Persicobacter sp. CCB-QB2]GJM60415.1 hypothetical protein PEDI_09670 [Persicobacter diffluens]
MILAIVVSIPAMAQKSQKKSFWDFFRLKKQKTPSEVYFVPDSLLEYSMEEAYLKESEAIDDFNFVFDSLEIAEMVRPPRSVFDYDDSCRTNIGTLDIPCFFLESQDYYSEWSTVNLNPYQVDGTKFKDTLDLPLFDDKHAYVSPLAKDTYITSGFGMRRYRWHYGTDLKLQTGDSVLTVFDGVVRMARYDRRGYGYYVVVRHSNGLETLYGHLSKILVKVGQEVKAGELIGKGGNTGRSTGSHLHIEVRYKGMAINPEEFFDFEDKSIPLKEEVLSLNPETFAYLKEVRKVVHHRIRSGDTLSHIARRYHTSINKICRLNGMSRNTVLRVGKVIRVR